MRIKKVNEIDTYGFYGGSDDDGVITVKIDSSAAKGEFKDLVVREIQKTFRNLGGEIHLFVDDTEVNSRGYA